MARPASTSSAATGGDVGPQWACLGPTLAGLLAVPFVINQNSWFEWVNALWLLQLQTAYVRLHGIPTFFINAPQQVLYPVHLFYAGPLFGVMAYPSVLFGAWPVFALTTVLAFIALASGVYLVARALGVPRPHAIAPGLLLATTPYVVSDLYGRGAWAELVALAALSMALGAAATILGGSTRPVGSFLTLVVASFILAGSHNITLMWTGIAAVPFVALLATVLRLRRTDLLRRGITVGAAGCIGVGLCGCFLLPNLVLARATLIGNSAGELKTLAADHQFETPAVVFSPLLTKPKITTPSDVHTQTASVAIIWTLLVLLGWGWRLTRRTLLEVAGAGLIAVVFAALVVDPDWWPTFPPFLWATQFAFRLVPFLTLSVLLGVVCLLRLPAIRGSRWATAALVLAVAWQSGLAGYQSASARALTIPPYRPVPASEVSTGRVPDSFGGAGFSQPDQFKLLAGTHVERPKVDASAPALRAKPPAGAFLSGPEPAGTLIATNVVYTPLTSARGNARIAGRDDHGYMVLGVLPHAASTWRVTLVAACPLCLSPAAMSSGYGPLVAGQALTVLSMTALLALAIWHRRRRGHRGRRLGDHYQPRHSTTRPSWR